MRFRLHLLSVLSAIVAFAERIPVIHIVGTPPTKQMKTKPLLHHTLGNGHFEAYSKAAEHFVVASATLSEPATAGAEIDRALVDCITKVVQNYDVPGRAPSHSSYLVAPRVYNTPNGPSWGCRFGSAARNTPSPDNA